MALFKYLAFTLISLYTSIALSEPFSKGASYKVCFTPSGHCTPLITDAIKEAQKEVLVQAYSFTSAPIAKALVQAYKRGVKVNIILDKSQTRQRGFSSAKFFSDYHVPVLIDYQPSIAHNKVMIIDQQIVITGSFNFTRAAEERNAENVIIIKDPTLAKKYLNNWKERAEVSSLLHDSLSPFEPIPHK